MEERSPLSEFQDNLMNGVVANGIITKKSTEPSKKSKEPSGDDQALYKRLLAEGKTAAANGDLDGSLTAFKKAYEMHPTEKILGRIKKIEDVMKEMDQNPDETDQFVELDNGLVIYRDLVERLYPHQIEGVKWIYDLQKKKKKGGILADDMGLGKTIQVISALSAMFDMEVIKHVLLVLPLSLIPNWQREFEKWAPGIKVKPFYGSVKERTKSLQYCQRRPAVCITTYGLVQTKWEQLGQDSLRKDFVWDYIILDEGHKIKNPSKTTKGLHAIPSRNRLILTGTPIQNNLRELWALFDWVMQGTLLGTQKTFRLEYETPITRARQRGASAGEIHLGNYMAESLRKIVDPYILRRTKGSVSAPNSNPTQIDKNQAAIGLNHQPSFPKLEKKNDFVIWTYLSDVQEEIYKDFLAQDSVKELLSSKKSPLVYLTILKKICDHPRLLPRRACQKLGLQANESFNEDDFHTDVGKECAANRIDNISDETLIQESGKLQFLLELLPRLREEEHRTLVFSQSRKVLNILHRILLNRKFKVMRLDGTVSKLSDRELRVKKFQQDSSYDVFLLTTQVGGVGLTLTAADRVVIFDPSWNPATDAQAVDRIYRIGQDKNVVVYRLITCGTVEEKIYRRQIFKDSIIKQSTGDNKDPYRYFTNHELKELFQLEDTKNSITQQQLNELHAGQRSLDPKLEEHLAFLQSLPMYGVSDHDLMFTQDPDDVDDAPDSHRDVIESKVAEAQNRVALEAQGFTGNEEAAQRWGDFKVPEVKKSPQPPPKEKEPVFAIEGLYDKLDSLKVDDNIAETASNASKISISSEDDQDQPNTDMQNNITGANAGNILDEAILVDDSPTKSSEMDNTDVANMGSLEIGESFNASDFDMVENGNGYSENEDDIETASNVDVEEATMRSSLSPRPSDTLQNLDNDVQPGGSSKTKSTRRRSGVTPTRDKAKRRSGVTPVKSDTLQVPGERPQGTSPKKSGRRRSGASPARSDTSVKSSEKNRRRSGVTPTKNDGNSQPMDTEGQGKSATAKAPHRGRSSVTPNKSNYLQLPGDPNRQPADKTQQSKQEKRKSGTSPRGNKAQGTISIDNKASTGPKRAKSPRRRSGVTSRKSLGQRVSSPRTKGAPKSPNKRKSWAGAGSAVTPRKSLGQRDSSPRTKGGPESPNKRQSWAGAGSAVTPRKNMGARGSMKQPKSTDKRKSVTNERTANNTPRNNTAAKEAKNAQSQDELPNRGSSLQAHGNSSRNHRSPSNRVQRNDVPNEVRPGQVTSALDKATKKSNKDKNQDKTSNELDDISFGQFYFSASSESSRSSTPVLGQSSSGRKPPSTGSSAASSRAGTPGIGSGPSSDQVGLRTPGDRILQDEGDVNMEDGPRRNAGARSSGLSLALSDEESDMSDAADQEDSTNRVESDDGADEESEESEDDLDSEDAGRESVSRDMGDFIMEDEDTMDGFVRSKQDVSSVLEDSTTDSPWNNRGPRNRTRRRSTALPQRRLIEESDESDEEDEANGYRERSSSASEDDGPTALRLTSESEDDY